MLARALAKRGHEVTWFISNFEHRSKSFRNWTKNDIALPGVSVVCLSARPYSSNISLQRVVYEHSFGISFRRTVSLFDKPDCVILAEPSTFYGHVVYSYCKINSIPIVIDVLDLWPEMFVSVLPKMLHWARRVIFYPFYNRRKRLFQSAAGIVGCTRAYTAIAKDQSACPVETVYLGVDVRAIQDSLGRSDLDELIAPFAGVTFVYAGTLGEKYDIPTVVSAFEQLIDKCNIRLVIAGAGPCDAIIRDFAGRFPGSVIFLGEVPMDQLPALYARSDVGICCYSPGSTVEMPVKFFDYLAAGLAVLTSLGGEIGEIVDRGVGLTYTPNDVVSLVRAIESVILNKTQLERMKARSRTISCEYDQAEQHERFAKFVECVV